MTDELSKQDMLQVLVTFDTDEFRVITEAPVETSEQDIIEAMHRVRIIHPGINRQLKRDSQNWLDTFSPERNGHCHTHNQDEQTIQ